MRTAAYFLGECNRRLCAIAPRRLRLLSTSTDFESAENEYKKFFKQSLENPENFWGCQAEAIHWFPLPPFSKPQRVLNDDESPFTKWFDGGLTNAAFNAIDRHVEGGNGARTALIYDSPVTETVERISYAELQQDVATFAGALRLLGVEPGDTVIIYMAMVPEAIVSMLACARIGAVHSVVFGGFAPPQLAQRINHAKPKVVIWSSCGFAGMKRVLYKPLLDEALSLAEHKPQCSIVVQREEGRATLGALDIDFATLMRLQAMSAPAIALPSTHPLYILYTSGTTGQPKGIVRDTGGYMVALKWTMQHIFDIHPGDVFFVASDIGWVVGHSYIVYGPLLQGATTVLYEGKPVGTPDASAYSRIISSYGVKALFTAPTAMRAIKREDAHGEMLRSYPFDSLEALFLAGERSDPDTMQWATKILNVPVVDNYWQTETGWPISATPLGLKGDPHQLVFGSAGRPMPGWNIHVLNDNGIEVKSGELGNIVAKLPLPPGAMTTLYKAPEKFKSTYMEHFKGFYATGDAGFLDMQGNLHVMARVDDIINVSGVRFSTAAVEEVLSAHPSVAECAVFGVNDKFRGELPIGLVVLKSDIHVDFTDVASELTEAVRSKIGAVVAFKYVATVHALPKTRSGKILRGLLRNIANGVKADVPGTIEDPHAVELARKALESLGYPAAR